MADAPVGSPEWWLRRLHKELIERRPALQLATDYYDGSHNLSFQSKRFREAFGGLFDAFADNWCEVVVDASEERLNVEGFRVGDDVAGDTDAWRIWQANDMDGQSQRWVRATCPRCAWRTATMRSWSATRSGTATGVPGCGCTGTSGATTTPSCSCPTWFTCSALRSLVPT